MGLASNYIQKSGKPQRVKGKKCNVVRWGGLYIYSQKGKWADFKRDAQTIYGNGAQFRLWKSTNYDQIAKFAALPTAQKKKITKISIEAFESVVHVYQQNGWSDVVEWVAYALVNGYPVYLLIREDDKAQAVFSAIVQEVQELANDGV